MPPGFPLFQRANRRLHPGRCCPQSHPRRGRPAITPSLPPAARRRAVTAVTAETTSGNVLVALLGLVGRRSPATASLGRFRTARRIRWFEIRSARLSVDAGRDVPVALLRRIGGIVPD